MATLIAVYTSDGCVGRCDARCHEAHEPTCDCICGGMNHGVGRQRAAEQTRELVEHWIERYAKEHGLTDYRAEVNPEVYQLGLFGSS
ncbi:hypothetical protein [Kallotenue papyrolyticum]|uniref:hypothetical protein n=1 Tax=Kallotenue papyrolyticum TaxID=1325125 RepID=UPI000478571A|nr:hypothetical protein [Kallotenue papyrolyticum]